VIESTVSQQVVHASDGSGLVIPGPEHDTRNARAQDGAGTHHAGFEGHDQGRVGQVPVPHRLGRRTDRDDFGVRGRILRLLALVSTNREAAAGRVEQQRRDRNVTRRKGETGLRDCLAHPFFVSCHGSPFARLSLCECM
jgi:hypothetical protein